MPANNLLVEWIAREPIGSLFALITSILLFSRFLRSNQSDSQKFSSDVILMLESAGKGIAFLGLLVGVYAFLSLSYRSFSALYGSIGVDGSLAQLAWLETRGDYPDWVIQQELQVRHFVDTTQLVQIPNPNPSKPSLYYTITNYEEVPQNSIASFRGHVDVTLKDKGTYQLKGTGYNNFSAKTRFEYKVVNQSEKKTQVEFTFPLQSTINYENVSVQVNGREMFSDVSITSGGILWNSDMLPGQEMSVIISYEAKGADNFLYKTPKREINNFVLDVETNLDSINVFAAPEGENFTAASRLSTDGQGIITTFSIDDVYLEPTMGCGFVAQAFPYDPQKSIVSALQFAPRASLLLGVLFALTILICTQATYFWQLIILLLLFAGQTLALMGAGPYVLSWRIVLFTLVFLFVLISYIALKRIPRLPRNLILTWTMFFSGFYPLASDILPDLALRSSFENILIVAIIIYVFVLTFLLRLRDKPVPQA